MPLLPLEKSAIKHTVQYGKSFGFGNLIDRLSIAWALDLKASTPTLSIKTCLNAGSADMHKWNTILKTNGEEKTLAIMREYIGE